jgi:hypothetical protein
MSKLGLARNLQRYLERYGANISRQIEVFETPQGKLGLRAVGLVQCFDILASIPEHLCIVDTTKYKPESEQSSLKAHAGLISRLINEKVNVQNSKHRLYIETMPKDISHFPRTWTPETWNSFKGTTLHYLYYNNFDRISDQHIDENEKGSAELVEWAQSIVSSRCLGMGGSLALVPFLDYASHDSQMCVEPIGTRGCIILKGESTANRGVVSYNLIALADHYPGMEIRQCFGNLSVEDKLMGYGWLDTKTPITEYASVNMSLPFAPLVKSYYKKPYTRVPCQFNLQPHRIGASVSSFIEEGGVTKRMLLNSLRRRSKELEGLLGYSYAGDGTPAVVSDGSQSRALVIVPEHSEPDTSETDVSCEERSGSVLNHRDWARSLLDRDLQAVIHLRRFLEDDGQTGYDAYRAQEEELAEDQKDKDDNENRNAAAYALLLHEHTGLDVVQDVIYMGDDDDDDEDGVEEGKKSGSDDDDDADNSGEEEDGDDDEEEEDKDYFEGSERDGGGEEDSSSFKKGPVVIDCKNEVRASTTRRAIGDDVAGENVIETTVQEDVLLPPPSKNDDRKSRNIN